MKSEGRSAHSAKLLFPCLLASAPIARRDVPLYLHRQHVMFAWKAGNHIDTLP